MMVASEVEHASWADTVRRLATEVSVFQTKLVEARVMLGHVLLSIRAKSSARDMEQVIKAAGVHRRRASEAVRLAEHFALKDGSVDWVKYHAMLAAKGRSDRGGAPSVRSMISLVKAESSAESAAVGADEEDVDLAALCDADPDAEPVEPAPDADEDFDADVFGEGAPDPDADENGAVVEEVAAGGRVVGAGGGVNSGQAGRRWAVGVQLSLGELYDRANGFADQLERTLASMNPDADTLRKPIRDRHAGRVMSRRWGGVGRVSLTQSQNFKEFPRFGPAFARLLRDTGGKGRPMAMKDGREYGEIGMAKAKAWGYAECPVCGSDHHCLAVKPGAVFRYKGEDRQMDRAVLCMSPPALDRVAGLVAIGKPGANGGRFFIQVDGSKSLTPAESDAQNARRKREEAEAARKSAELQRLARDTFMAATPEAHGAAAYFYARGVKTMTGGERLPSCIRYLPSLDYFIDGAKSTPGPAIVAAVTDAAGAVVAVHRIYLAIDGSPSKRAAEHCGKHGAKVALGPIAGGAVRLGGEGSMTLIMCEGIETGLKIREAMPDAEVWSCISGEGLRGVVIPEDLKARVTKVIIAADLDKWADKKRGRPGHQYATAAALRLRGICTGAEVLIAMPGVVHLPAAIDENGAPRSEKGADWLDVGNAEGGLARVRSGMLHASPRVEEPAKTEWEEARGRAGPAGGGGGGGG